MSLSSQYLNGKQVIKQKQMALWERVRQNFSLKVISLITALLLYFYVQQERNPTVTRNFSAPIVFEPQRPELEILPESPMLDVTVTGPRQILDSLKEGDIRLIGNTSNISTEKVESRRIHTNYDVRLSEQSRHELIFDPPPSVQIQVYPERTLEREVEVHFSKNTQPGFRYGHPNISPSHVKIVGRADRVDKIAHVVADADPATSGAAISGEFPLTARDRDGNTVEGVSLSVSRASIKIPLVEEPYARIVSVSYSIQDQPRSPFRLSNVTVEPIQVRIMGRPDQINQLPTLQTEDISVRDFTSSQTVLAKLVVPEGVTVQNINNVPVKRVRVRIDIVNSTSTPPVTPNNDQNPPHSISADGH